MMRFMFQVERIVRATLEADADAVHFLNEAFKHCKAIAADELAIQVFGSRLFLQKTSCRIFRRNGIERRYNRNR